VTYIWMTEPTSKGADASRVSLQDTIADLGTTFPTHSSFFITAISLRINPSGSSSSSAPLLLPFPLTLLATLSFPRLAGSSSNLGLRIRLAEDNCCCRFSLDLENSLIACYVSRLSVVASDTRQDMVESLTYSCPVPTSIPFSTFPYAPRPINGPRAYWLTILCPFSLA